MSGIYAGMARPEIPPDEAASALGARRELGAEMEPAVVEAFVERVEREIDARVDARLAERGGGTSPPRQGFDGRLGLALASLGIATPLTAIAGGIGGLVAILIVWIGIVAVNVARARGQGAATRDRR